ncbi:DUF6932 family protein [Actinomycetospora chibensis]|uniref:DUF6932 family protein n=1 Tax=Actinomycetospora chibensis TaxID=663606 RepID=A0ABV9RNX1_9PSEU
MFGPDGYLPSRVLVSPDQLYEGFVAAFPQSTTRANLFQAWLFHRVEVAELVRVRMQWIGGSFATSRVDPPDIDVVTFIEGPEFETLSPGRIRLVERLFEGPKTRDERGVDAYVVAYYPETHPARFGYARARGDWDDHFSRLKDDHDRSRGYLEVRDDPS